MGGNCGLNLKIIQNMMDIPFKNYGVEILASSRSPSVGVGNKTVECYLSEFPLSERSCLPSYKSQVGNVNRNLEIRRNSEIKVRSYESEFRVIIRYSKVQLWIPRFKSELRVILRILRSVIINNVLFKLLNFHIYSPELLQLINLNISSKNFHPNFSFHVPFRHIYYGMHSSLCRNIFLTHACCFKYTEASFYDCWSWTSIKIQRSKISVDFHKVKRFLWHWKHQDITVWGFCLMLKTESELKSSKNSKLFLQFRD